MAKGAQNIAGVRFPKTFRFNVQMVGVTRGMIHSKYVGRTKLQTFSVIPGPAGYLPVLRDYCRKPEGTVTAFSSGCLPICNRTVGEDTLVEVTEFSRLVRRLHIMCGLDTRPIAPDRLEVAAFDHACSLLPENSPFALTAHLPGTQRALLAVLRELHEHGLTSEDLRQSAAEAEPTRAAKLISLAHLDESLASILESANNTRLSELLWGCLNTTPELDGSLDRLLVIVGADYRPLRVRWLRWLADSGVDVKVVTYRHATDGALFENAQRVQQALGAKVESKGDGNRLIRSLFSVAPPSGADISATIQPAPDSMAEVEWVLRKCLEVHLKEEAKPDQCAIFVRDLETYAPLFVAASLRLQVPIHLPRRIPLLSNQFAKLMLGVLEFAASTEVISLEVFLNSSYFALPPQTQTQIRSALRESHRDVRGGWIALAEWANLNSESLPWFHQLIQWRLEVVTESRAITEWVNRLDEIIEILGWLDESRQVRDYDGERDQRAHTVLKQTLSAAAGVDQATQAPELSFTLFVRKCRRLWESADVSVPASEAHIGVYSDISALPPVDHLFVLGMLEGIFPKRRSEESILADEDRHWISKDMLAPAQMPDSHIKARAERDQFYSLVACAKSSLHLSYPLTDDERDNVPAFYLSAIREITGVPDLISPSRKQIAPNIEDCWSEADRVLRSALDGPKDMLTPISVTLNEALRVVQPQGEEAHSPHTWVDASLCPFKFVAGRRLHLRTNRTRHQWSNLRDLPQSVGLYVRDNLEEAEPLLTAALKARISTMAPETEDWELKMLQLGGVRKIQSWIKLEREAREKWGPRVQNFRSGPFFGDPGLRSQIIDGVQLSGQISGLSELAGYKVAHVGISLPHYKLKKLGRGDRPDQTFDRESQGFRYLGLMYLSLWERGSFCAIEFEGFGSKQRTLAVFGRSGGELPFSDGEFLRVENLLDRGLGPIDEFCRETKSWLKRTAGEMKAGTIDARPGDHCDHCDFGDLCRRHKSTGEQLAGISEPVEGDPFA